MQLIDSHCHLDVDAFDHDRADVVARARAAGVTRQIVPAIDAAGWPRLRETCTADPGLFPAYGLHPIVLGSHRPQHIDELRAWIEREHPLAIGECGLDFFIDDPRVDEQLAYFEPQLLLAREFDIPVIVHARRAVDAVIAAIRKAGGIRGVVHSFSGSVQQARQLWQLGFLVGLGGPVTYERATRLRKLAATMPIEYLLLETDAPDQPDSGHKGQRNEPSRLVDVLETIARLRGEDPAHVAAATTINAERLFRLPAQQ
ncbi:TatD family hydrolase [Cognatiluteimonas profundi]|uniref:TatD family hydrolase n=1 Tax=Cognatiluteimonas profundi TaxID=2594501 RepID=UPI00131B1CB7|nr:TatD family hydrolase [Lysobacter profundi]